ncbi:potassium-transporting ATPase subunit KdpC [Acinetobacter sp. AOR15_HL]|uniref:potassium-transporting ATPase subunit KdpC n=1 Tax=unclassified Acinetobacter TaxID=196816 RepID=UPI0022EB0740|nr:MULTISPECIES: potassium-transporting ATPase subunit KdpC [unclassified Acinetobacter]MDA3558686.1 potassium-transporting ATPase subunit KdpC [Acinetobacter sp. AOR15_HL]MDA3571150.1 potassium-transporting ATPase subunit KdpC [Acinetobacter sp. AOR14_HL]
MKTYVQNSEANLGQTLRASLGLLIFTLVGCGAVYSAIATGVGQILFNNQANGSLIEIDQKVVGSTLVAQPFVGNEYFHPRPSAANYEPMAMAGTNLARTNPELQKQIDAQILTVKKQNHTDNTPIPSDLVTKSGSGIDPHISPEAAQLQVARVAQARHLDLKVVEELLQKHIEPMQFGVLGQARVNVLELNIALDQLQSTH